MKKQQTIRKSFFIENNLKLKNSILKSHMYIMAANLVLILIVKA